MPITDITKLIGREWKELPKEKQQVNCDFSLCSIQNFMDFSLSIT